MRSIVQSERECFVCKTTMSLELHHIFGGAYRKKSDRLGLTVYLCHKHHNEPPYGVHHNRERMDWLRAIGQRRYIEHYHKTKDDFIREFGRNYL